MKAIFLGYKEEDGSPVPQGTDILLELPLISVGTVLQVQPKPSPDGRFPWRTIDPKVQAVSLRDIELSFSPIEEIPLEDYL